MNFLGLGGGSVSFVFKFTSAVKGRPLKKIAYHDGVEELVIFQGTEPIRGEVTLIPKGKKVEHLGIKVELIGQIEMMFDRGNPTEFAGLVRELDSPGVIMGNKTYAFDFSKAPPKEYESYRGSNVNVRYFLRVTVTKQYGISTQEQEIWIQNVQVEPEVNNSLKMEVGIESCLHIEFEYKKAKYHPMDSVIGKVYFLLVRIKIKYMEIAIVRKETIGSGENQTSTSDVLKHFEVMEGCPVRGEAIPVRLFLSQVDKLSPTYDNVNNQFSVKYFLNLVLVDMTDRRYFKQQEITIWRKELG